MTVAPDDSNNPILDKYGIIQLTCTEFRDPQFITYATDFTTEISKTLLSHSLLNLCDSIGKMFQSKHIKQRIQTMLVFLADQNGASAQTGNVLPKNHDLLHASTARHNRAP